MDSDNDPNFDNGDGPQDPPRQEGYRIKRKGKSKAQPDPDRKINQIKEHTLVNADRRPVYLVIDDTDAKIRGTKYEQPPLTQATTPTPTAAHAPPDTTPTLTNTPRDETTASEQRPTSTPAHTPCPTNQAAPTPHTDAPKATPAEMHGVVMRAPTPPHPRATPPPK